MMKNFLAVVLLVACNFSLFGKSYTEPPVGSSQRKEALEAIRKTVETYFRQPVIFKVDTLKVSKQWACIWAEARKPDGAVLDYKLCKIYKNDPDGLRIQMHAGELYGGVVAFLKKTKKGWHIEVIVYDATDVFYENYDKRYGIPKDMLSSD